MRIRLSLIIGVLVLTGCGQRPSGDGASEVQTNVVVPNEEPTHSNIAPANNKSGETPPAPKPVVDLAIDSISLPASVTRATDFTISAIVVNNSDTKVNFAELEARATVTSPTDALNLHLGSGSVENLAPHASQTVELKGNIPGYTAPAYTADITVSVKPPSSVTDPNENNNWRTQKNVVVH